MLGKSPNPKNKVKGNTSIVFNLKARKMNGEIC